ncbi:MAG TPA: serpin family protein [Polyangiaceae bacterium]|nr:serpin family protein [Polyangiaceae bacterium]
MNRRLFVISLLGVSLGACSSGPSHGPRIAVDDDHPGGSAGTGGDGPGLGSGGADGSAEGVTFARSPLARSNPLLATPDALTNTVDDATSFAFSLERELSASPGNLFFSPFSIETVLAMAWAGAKGRTAEEIAAVFHFGEQEATHGALGALDAAVSVDSSDVLFSSVNALWASPSITVLSPFLDVLGVNYGAGVGLVDFDDPVRAAAAIDRWVSDQTHGAIPELLDAADFAPRTKCVLTNAAHFDAKWEAPFDPSSTHPGTFARGDGTSAPATFMSSLSTIPYVSGSGYEAASLAYVGREGHHYEMLLVLPAGTMADLESGLGAAWLSSVRDAMRPTSVDLTVPRFEVRTPLRLKGTLERMGMPTPFDYLHADFSGITNTVPLYVREVVHQGFLSVNEAGTTASAATGVILGVDGGIDPNPPTPVTMRLDRPFLVMIRHVETGALLFLGRVSEI